MFSFLAYAIGLHSVSYSFHNLGSHGVSFLALRLIDEPVRMTQ